MSKTKIKNWLELRPYTQQAPTDAYYLKIGDKINQILLKHRFLYMFEYVIKNEDTQVLSYLIASYFEDLISGTNIWNTFVRVHQRLYGKPLPFYEGEAYYEGEINPQDISFLLWYGLSSLRGEQWLRPVHGFFREASKEIMAVLDAAWDFAPENKVLKHFYQINPKEEDFYKARALMDTLFFKTYLFSPDTLLRLKVKEQILSDHLGENKGSYDLKSLLNGERDSALHTMHTRLLGLSAKEWAAELLGEDHLLSKDLLNISQKIQGLFFYKGQDDAHVFLEHIASGKKFSITKKSFKNPFLLTKEDTPIYIGIIMWKEEWWFSGVLIIHELSQQRIDQEKNSLESKKAVSFLDHERKETAKNLEKQWLAFKAYNNGLPIAFLASDRIEPFQKGFSDFFNHEILVLTEDEIKALKNRGSANFEQTAESLKEIAEHTETGLLFLNPKSGLEIALGINSAFLLPSNPYFKEEDSDDHVTDLLMDSSYSTELVMYCLDHCKAKLSFFADEEGQLILDNIDFLLRFWKRENYHTKPSVVYTD